jgi:hypothetical protein
MWLSPNLSKLVLKINKTKVSNLAGRFGIGGNPYFSIIEEILDF